MVYNFPNKLFSYFSVLPLITQKIGYTPDKYTSTGPKFPP